MKKLITPIIIVSLITATLFSCHKAALETTASIQGKWSLKMDSVAEAVSGPTPITRYGTDYKGTSADYFDFRSDNKLYIKEGAKLDTFNYQLSTDSNIYISSPNTSEYGIASTLNGLIKPGINNNVTIQFTPAEAVFGAYYLRTVDLTK
jgi:hypothetical protein